MLHLSLFIHVHRSRLKVYPNRSNNKSMRLQVRRGRK